MIAAESGSYDVIVRYREGRYFAWISELNLVAEADSAAAAHSALEELKRDLLAKLQKLAVAPPLPGALAERRALRAAIMPFLIKAAAVAAVGSILLVSGGVALNYAVGESLRNATQKTSRAALEQVIRGIEDMGRRDLTAERAERLRAALRGLVPVAKPFIEELRPLFAEKEAPSSSASAN